MSIPKQRVRILFVHYGGGKLRGSERCLLNLLEGLNRKAYHVTIWCNEPVMGQAAAPLVDEVIQSEFAPPLGFYSMEPDVPLQRKLSILWRLICQAHTHVKAHRPALIICNSLAPAQWMVPVSLCWGVPLIVYLHTNYLPGARVLSMAYGASHLVAVSNFALQGFLCDGFTSAHAQVIYNGVHVPAVSARRDAVRANLRIADDEFVVAVVCALDRWKRVDVVTDAVRLLQAEGVGVRLVVVGDGQTGAELRARAADTNVIFCGWQSDVGKFVAAADCMATAAEKEAFGLSVVEAAALGRPTVAAGIGGLLEVVKPGITGLFFRTGSSEDCAKQIRALIDDPAQCLEMGRQAQRLYHENYTVERMTAQLLTVIDAYCRPRNTGDQPPSRWTRSVRLFRLSLRSILSKLTRKSSH